MCIGIYLRTGIATLLVSTILLAGDRPAAAASLPIPPYAGAVPALCYHGIRNDGSAVTDPYSITRGEFARQMAMLTDGGFHAISIAQYARFAAGDVAALPVRPILITFDDGRLDSYRGADQVLARYGMRATMFVITANAAGPKPGYLSWPQLAGMAASGRWDLQEHAHAGHVLIPTGPGNQTGPYYANLLYRSGARETFTAFKRRVTGDILTGRRLMASHISGFEPLAFAPPYDNYGQLRTNYAPIPAWESAWLERTFEVLFVQDRRIYNLPGNRIGQRYGIHSWTTAALLQRWLADKLPRSAVIAPTSPPPAPARPHSRRPPRPSLRRLRVGRRQVLMVFKIAAHTRLAITRRRAGRRHRVRISTSAAARVRDRRLRPGTIYVYRAVAIDAAGHRSRALRVRVHTR